MLFRKRESKPAPFPTEQYEPVIRSSICTGERTACMRDRQTGKVHEIMLIRSPQDLAQFDDSEIEEGSHDDEPYQTPNGVKISFHNVHAIILQFP